MRAWLPGPDGRRRRLLARAPPGPLRDYLAAPYPPPATRCRDARFLALDLETTGLDPSTDEILSAGWVCLEGLRIDLSTARHRLLRPTQPVPAGSAVIHGITDDRAATGGAPRAVLTELLGALGGRVLLAHHAAVERAFLDAACRDHLGGGILVPAVDTLALGRRALLAGGERTARASLRLDALRRRHHLPRYRAHDALSDALAAAELFLALLSRRSPDGALTLRQVLAPW